MPLILGRRGNHSRTIGFAERARPEAGELITYSGDGHLITFAPTGTGKTSGPVICNALTHPGQIIVLDMKGEVYKATAEARRNMGQEVHVLDLRDGHETGSLNPLDLASRTGTEAAAIARSFAADLIERATDERGRFWNDYAETLLAGGAAWLLEDVPKHRRTLSSLFDILTDDDAAYRIALLLDQKEIRNRAAKAAFTSFLQRSAQGAASFRKHSPERARDGAHACAAIRQRPDAQAHRYHVVQSRCVHRGRTDVPLYRCAAFPAHRLPAVAAFHLAIRPDTGADPAQDAIRAPDPAHLRRSGKPRQARYAAHCRHPAASWGLTLWTFWQNAAQLQIYGAQANTLIDNAGVIQTFGARNRRMAQDFVNLVGGVSADEILKMPRDEQILLIEANPLQAGAALQR